MELAHRAVRGRLDRRDGDSLQNVALSIGPRPGVGHPAAPRHPPQERVDLLDAGAAQHGRAAGAQSRLVRRHAGRSRPAAASKNFEIKPYAISRLSTDRVRATPINNDFDADLGGDIKYGVTASLTDTINTDFAQVEIDEQQVNLRDSACSFPRSATSFSKVVAYSTLREAAPARRWARSAPPTRPRSSTAGASA